MSSEWTPLEVLQRRLSHVGAIASLVAEHDDTVLGEALRGIAEMISDCGAQLDAIINPAAA